MSHDVEGTGKCFVQVHMSHDVQGTEKCFVWS